jgi:pyruvate dehydrogenase E1 component alpha subunit
VSKKSTASAEKKADSAPAVTDYAKAPANSRLSREEKIELHRKMVRIRRFEERSLRAYQAKKIGGFSTSTSARRRSRSAAAR